MQNARKNGEITVCFVNDAKIKELNRKYLGYNRPTDVITFETFKDKKTIISDIAISIDAARRNAKSYKTTILYELCLYTVHGVLHILGYDDRTAKQRALMDKKSYKILISLKLNRDAHS